MNLRYLAVYKLGSELRVLGHRAERSDTAEYEATLSSRVGEFNDDDVDQIAERVGNINYSSINGLGFVAVTSPDYPVRIVNDCLKKFSDAIKEVCSEDDLKSCLDEDACLNRSTKTVCKEIVKTYENYQDLDQVSALQSKVDATTRQMQDNVTQAVSNLENTDALSQKTDMLEEDAAVFKKGATKVRQQAWWKNMKLNIIIAIIAVCIIGFIVFMIVK